MVRPVKQSPPPNESTPQSFAYGSPILYGFSPPQSSHAPSTYHNNGIATASPFAGSFASPGGANGDGHLEEFHHGYGVNTPALPSPSPGRYNHGHGGQQQHQQGRPSQFSIGEFWLCFFCSILLAWTEFQNVDELLLVLWIEHIMWLFDYSVCLSCLVSWFD